ncbi:Proteasome assembly chaperone 1 [Desmophyllum pertusum]|uniref:Proteasome assembly chaperone 1 n=1 Tax=Desmophyllum pertusum TaxID=174260 RepID=A0A9W9YRK7_9CNID|nr:Proteasome assembly chaperone 1 [Desmophyllum pertusum]
MAAAFGVWEIKFPSSRAVYDEDDEEDEEHSSEDDLRSLHFHRAPHLDQKPSPTECPLLVLAIGEVATTFVEAHFLSAGSEIVACITSKKTNEVDFEKLCSTYKSADTCCLHRLTTSQDDSVLCQCRTTVPQEKAFHWTEKLFENFKPSKVVILTSAPACEYHTNTPGNLKPDFVKVLKTDSWQEKISHRECSFWKLLTSSVESQHQFCQIHSMAAALFVCFTESSHVDSQSVEAFHFLLKHPPLRSLHQASSEQVTKVLKSLRSGKLLEMNMYM